MAHEIRDPNKIDPEGGRATRKWSARGHEKSDDTEGDDDESERDSENATHDSRRDPLSRLRRCPGNALLGATARMIVNHDSLPYPVTRRESSPNAQAARCRSRTALEPHMARD